MPNNNFANLEYAPWLEESLKDLFSFPVTGICIHAVDKNGSVYSNYHDISIADKIKIAGYIQQDAMIETLRVNGLIANSEDDEESEDELDG